MTDKTCEGCRKYAALRDEAKQAGNYRAAADYELLRRRHPSHDDPGTAVRWGLPA